jgi:hypothetical protein
MMLLSSSTNTDGNRPGAAAGELPLFGVQVASEDLTHAIVRIGDIVGPLYLWFRGWKTGHFTFGGTRLK